MIRGFIVAVVLAAACIGVGASGCYAQSYPSRQITYIIPYSPGGASDTTGRIFAKRLSEALGQPVIVQNKSGGAVGIVQLGQSKPDGYTLGHISTDAFSITPQFEETPPYDAFKDFIPVAHLLTTYTALVAANAFGPSSVKEMIAYAKQNPGKVTVASTGVGGYTHLLGELLKQAAGIDTTHVPYSNTGGATVDLLAGRVDLMFNSTPVELVGSGRAKGLAAVGQQRIKQLPNLPTMAEVLPAYRGGDIGWALVAPAGTPPEIVKKLSDTVASFSAAPDYVRDVEARGYAVSFAPYDQYPKQLREEYDVYGEAIRRGNIKIHN
jgi:tripartite-type tricarboxylate transporter receptor subunit TctC